MSQHEKYPTGFSKDHIQSHLNESSNQSSHDISGSFTACSSMERTHHFISDKQNQEEMMEDKETNEESVSKEDDKTESENIEDVLITSTKPIQNAHTMDSQEDSHLFNYFSKEDDKAAGKSMTNWEGERSLPWNREGDREQNLSVPMYLYLLNNDIKSKISNLDQKEFEACRARKWDEALRMRGMKSKLSLTREHQLLNAVGLTLDEETRSLGMKSIEERQKLVEKREKLISDGNLYSEEAREIWKKWEAEDNQLEMNTSFIERAEFMQSLEEEWKVLADEDKDRVAQLYGKHKPEFPIDHRHKQTQNYP